MSDAIVPFQHRSTLGAARAAGTAVDEEAAALQRSVGADAPPVEYDLHGIVGIRLVDADERDARAVAKQLGPIDAPLQRDPDITVRFVDRLATGRGPRLLGLGEAAYDDDAFFVLRAKHKARARVRVPFADIGGRCEIVCEKGLPAVPLLIATINLTALAKNVLPLHASAFLHDGRGVLATGWSKGGKTESLLSFMARGAAYVGDEWVYLSEGGDRMHGIPEPIRIWDWHLAHLPEYRTRISLGDRARLGAVRAVERLDRVVASNGRARRVLARAMPLVKKQGCVDVRPHALFGAGACALAGPLDKLFFVASHASPDVVVRPVDPSEIAERMVFSLEEERRDFMSYYRSFRFAFPAVRNELIESTEALQRTLLHRALDDKEAYELLHPYPVDLGRLYDAMSPICETGSSARQT